MGTLAETINGLHETEPIKPGGPLCISRPRRVRHRGMGRLVSSIGRYEYCGDIPRVELEAAAWQSQILDTGTVGRSRIDSGSEGADFRGGNKSCHPTAD